MDDLLPQSWFTNVMGNDMPGAPAAATPPPATPAAAPENLLQGLSGYDQAPPADAPADLTNSDGYAGVQADNAAPTNLLQALTQQAGTPAPQPRRSLLDTIGRLGDVFAKVGGAPDQYQTNVDSRQNRQIALEDHARQIASDALKDQLTKTQIAEGNVKVSDDANTVMGKTLTALAGRPDAGAIWAQLAPQMGIPPEKAAAIGALIQTHPELVGPLASRLSGGKPAEYSMTPTVVMGPDGKPRIVQMSSAGGFQDSGLSPMNPLKEVDQGGRVGLADPYTGELRKGWVKTGTPSADSLPIVDGKGNITGYQVAPGSKTAQDLQREGDAADAKGNKPGKEGDPYTIYSGAKTQINAMDAALADLRNDPNLPGATGYVGGALDTPARQAVNAKVAAIKGMAVPVATALLRAQGVSRPSQSEVMSTANGIISDLGLLRQSTSGYVGSIDRARAGLRDRVTQLDANAQRTGVAGANGQPVSAPSTRPILTTRRPAAPAPAARGGWGKVIVH